MKIDIAQIEVATFRRLAWWSNWIDVAVFDYDSTPFLLQMRVSRTNGKQFNAIRMTGRFVYRQSSCAAIGDLVQMGERT